MPVTIRPADLSDAKAISVLMIANSASQGGSLAGDWSLPLVESWIARGDLVLVAEREARIVGVLFTTERRHASGPPVLAMVKAWPGDPDAYLYGPVCVEVGERGHGIFETLCGELQSRIPDRDGMLFINRDNLPSLRAHARVGMKPVASFSLGGNEFLVLCTPD